MYSRYEDDDVGLHIRARELGSMRSDVGKAFCTVDKDMTNNPSDRRGGIVLGFECEFCPEHIFGLNIVQHKGSTYLNWRPTYLVRRVTSRLPGSEPERNSLLPRDDEN